MPLVVVVVVVEDGEEVAELALVVVLPADSLVLVPSETKGLLWVNGVVVEVIPGQLVLPMTVMVEGWLSPSLTAFFPVLQLQLESPGQQYFERLAVYEEGYRSKSLTQSCAVLHFAKGIDVFASEIHAWLMNDSYLISETEVLGSHTL